MEKKKIEARFEEVEALRLYPGAAYQRLFNWLHDKNFIALQSEMNEVIEIVKQDFPSETHLEEEPQGKEDELWEEIGEIFQNWMDNDYDDRSAEEIALGELSKKFKIKRAEPEKGGENDS